MIEAFIDSSSKPSKPPTIPVYLTPPLSQQNRERLQNIDTLTDYLDTNVAPFSGLLSKNAACYQHLEYVGCGSINIGGLGLRDVLIGKYGGVFSKGFIKEEIEKRDITVPVDSPIFIPCLHDQGKLQVNAINKEALREECQRLKIDTQETSKLIDLHKSCLMKGAEIKKYLEQLRPYMKNVFDVWEHSLMRRLHLTSVGIAIGHANVKRQVGELTDLSIWIN